MWFLLLAVSGMMVILLHYSAASAEGIRKGLSYSSNYLIPSLFPFMFISSMIMYSGVYEYFGKIFSLVFRHLFRLPEEAAFAVVMSLTGGFPVGAKCVSMLFSSGKINHSQAVRMMMFCVCSGPAFLITAVGTMMLHNMTAGVILYISQVISAFLIGIITARFDKTDATRKHISAEHQSISDSLILSSSDSAYAILEMTALVAIFSMIMSVIETIGVDRFFDCVGILPEQISGLILPVILEVTGACSRICEGAFPLWAVSFAAGFGGLCVHLQIFGILKSVNIGKSVFLIFRLVNAVLSSLVTYAICCFYRPEVQVFAVSETTEAEWVSGTYIGAAALVVMCMIFVLSLKRSYYANRPLRYSRPAR